MVPMEILHGDCVKISYPNFIRIFTAWETNKYPITNIDKKTCLYIKMEKAGFYEQMYTFLSGETFYQ